MMSVFPTWDARRQLGQRLNAGEGYDIMLVFDAPAVELAAMQSGGALCFNALVRSPPRPPSPVGRR